MKTRMHCSILLAGFVSLALAPFALAGDADKKFAKMDTNGDGRVTREEHALGAQQMFAKLDTNQDGIVTAAEMDAKKEKKSDKQRHEMSASEKISEIDQNGDGRLTAAEHVAGTEMMFDKMDTNRDGVLSKEECDSGHKMMKKDKQR